MVSGVSELYRFNPPRISRVKFLQKLTELDPGSHRPTLPS